MKSWKDYDARDCILWDGYLNHNGAPTVYVKGDPKTKFVCRLIVEERDGGGKLPPEMEVGHYCGVKACINPDHLFAATRAMRRRIKKELGHLEGGGPRLTHCKRGHLLAEPNLVYKKKSNGDRYRACKECQRIRGREEQRKRRGYYYGGEAFKDVCRNGHPRTEENTLVEQGGRRRCAVCRQESRDRNREAHNARRRKGGRYWTRNRMKTLLKSTDEKHSSCRSTVRMILRRTSKASSLKLRGYDRWSAITDF